jgi:hypothetical protein
MAAYVGLVSRADISDMEGILGLSVEWTLDGPV